MLQQQLDQQVLPDGTHDERSPMYQALLVEATLRLAGVAVRSGRPHAIDVRTLAANAGHRMLRSLDRMVHPDGGYALLNDTALGVAPSLASLHRACRRRSITRLVVARVAWERGVRGFDSGEGQYLVFDSGAIGPDHQPGHGMPTRSRSS